MLLHVLFLPAVLLFCVTAQRTGYTLDLCTTNENCRSPRVCLDPTTQLPCTHRYPTHCRCLPSSFTACTASPTCPRGELCATPKNTSIIPQPPSNSSALCVSCQVASRPRSFYIPISSDADILCPRPLGSGMSDARCLVDAECAPPRLCKLNDQACEEIQLPTAECTCKPPKKQLCDGCDIDECPVGELCGKWENSTDAGECTDASKRWVPLHPGPHCFITPQPELTAEPAQEPTNAPALSPLPLQSVSPTASENIAVCIGLHHLQHMKKQQLVFEHHRMAMVLCDGQGSCATPPHVVVWMGNALTMREYCAKVSACTSAEMLVNSPRWTAGVRVASHTNGLRFTALAARWETLVEREFLRVAVRFGA